MLQFRIRSESSIMRLKLTFQGQHVKTVLTSKFAPEKCVLDFLGILSSNLTVFFLSFSILIDRDQIITILGVLKSYTFLSGLLLNLGMFFFNSPYLKKMFVRQDQIFFNIENISP